LEIQKSFQLKLFLGRGHCSDVGPAVTTHSTPIQQKQKHTRKREHNIQAQMFHEKKEFMIYSVITWIPGLNI